VLGLLRDARDTGGTGGSTITGITFSGQTPTFPASPSGKVATNCLGNMVIRGMLNLSLVSGGDTYSLFASTALSGGGNPPVTGLNTGGIGSYAGGTGIAQGIIGQLSARIDSVNYYFIF
jgi:hypothetical protein